MSASILLCDVLGFTVQGEFKAGDPGNSWTEVCVCDWVSPEKQAYQSVSELPTTRPGTQLKFRPDELKSVQKIVWIAGQPSAV